MLFYTKYGCSVSHESLIVDSDSYERANDWAEASAQDVYYSYDCNYLSDEDYDEYTEEEVSEMEYQDMLNDIDWTVEPFDKDNEEHMDAWNEQGAKPFEI
jgi:hypothetical protein